jgi:hypothetical protein
MRDWRFFYSKLKICSFSEWNPRSWGAIRSPAAHMDEMSRQQRHVHPHRHNTTRRQGHEGRRKPERSLPPHLATGSCLTCLFDTTLHDIYYTTFRHHLFRSTKIIGYPGLLIPSYKTYSCELTWKPAARCRRWPHEGTGWFNPSPGWRSAQCQVILCADPLPHPHRCCSAPQHFAAVAGCSSGQEQPAPPQGCAAAATRETKRQRDKLRT